MRLKVRDITGKNEIVMELRPENRAEDIVRSASERWGQSAYGVRNGYVLLPNGGRIGGYAQEDDVLQLIRDPLDLRAVIYGFGYGDAWASTAPPTRYSHPTPSMP